MKKKYLIFFIFFNLIQFNAFSQNKFITNRKSLITHLTLQPPSLGRDTSILRYKMDIFNAYVTDKKLDSARFWMNDAYAQLKVLKWEPGWGYFYRTRGYFYVFSSKPDSATADYLKAITIWEKYHNWREAGIASARLGMALAGEEKHEKALQFFNKALAIFIKSNDYFSQANVYNYLADMYRIQGNYPKALEQFRKSIILIENGKTTANVIKYDVVGTMFLMNNQPDSAIFYFNKSGKNPLKIPSSITDPFVSNRLAEYFLDKRDFQQATRFGLHSLSLSQKSQSDIHLKRAHVLLYSAYKGVGKLDSALFHYENSNAIINKYNNVDVQKKIEELEIQYQTEKKEALIANQNKNIVQNKLAIFQKTAALQLTKKNLEFTQQKLAKEDIEKKLQKEIFNSQTKQQQQKIEQLRIENLLKQQQHNRIALGIGIVLLLLLLAFLGWRNRQLKQKNQAITDALLQGQTTERKRIAADLHDNLGSTMSALNWSLEAIDAKKLSPQEQEVYKHVKRTIANAHEQVRLLSHNLLPDEFEKQGLIDALYYLTRKINQNKATQFALEIAPTVGRLDKRIEFELYSICLELTNNILKHSKATQARIQLSLAENQIILKVSDNGQGLFDNASDGKGMKNIKARVESLGGHWLLENQLAGGVMSTISLPLPNL